MYIAIVAVVLIAGWAMTVRESLWHNLVLLCCITLASVFAFGTYQNVTVSLDEATDGELTYVLDLIVFWALFAFFIQGLKATGRKAAKTNVKFLHPLEQYGAPAVGFLCGLTLASVAAMSIHMASLPRDTMGGAINYDPGAADNPSLITIKPDMAFLAAASIFTNPDGLGGEGEFEPGPWVEDYAQRRERFAELMLSAKAPWELKAARNQAR